jgi:hypothetical protein
VSQLTWESENEMLVGVEGCVDGGKHVGFVHESCQIVIAYAYNGFQVPETSMRLSTGRNMSTPRRASLRPMVTAVHRHLQLMSLTPELSIQARWRRNRQGSWSGQGRLAF